MKLLTVQDSFQEVIDEVEDGKVEQEKFWVALRDFGDDTKQEIWYLAVGKDVPIEDKERQVLYQKMTANGSGRVTIRGQHYKLRVSDRVFEVKEGISCLTQSLDEKSLVVGTRNGDLMIFKIGERELGLERTVKGAHIEDILAVKVFPSNQAILTCGIDLCIKIWSITGELKRKISGHKMAIGCLGLLGETGRNFVSGSRDGTVKLWECGSGKEVHSFLALGTADDPVNCLVVCHEELEGTKVSELEFETLNQGMYVGYDSGIIRYFSIGDHGQKWVLGNEDRQSVHSVCFYQSMLISGHSEGQIKIWDTTTKVLKWSYRLNWDHPVTNIEIIDFGDEVVDVVVANGPETLVRLKIGLKGPFGPYGPSNECNEPFESIPPQVTYLVGMEEAFVPNGITRSTTSSRVFASSQHQIACYLINI